MAFVDYGDEATYLHIRDTYSRYHTVTFIGTKTKKEQTADKLVDDVWGNCVSFFTPGIILTGIDSIYRIKIPTIRNEQNITIETVTHGNHQSLGDTTRRHMYFKDIAHRILDRRKDNEIGTVE